MLAKARCDNIIRRSALSIPDEFLSRVLFCSGLSRPSVIIIIQKLGNLVEAARDRHDVVEILLAPINSNGWNIGQTGKKQEVTTKRKIFDRIAAYCRLYTISFPAANPFLVILLDEAELSDFNEAFKGTQPQIIRTNTDNTGTMDSATSFLLELGDVKTVAAMEHQ